MNKFNEPIAAILGVAFLVFFTSTIGGTILYLIYPALLVFFPNAVSSGFLAPQAEWWICVQIVWVSNLLIKSSTTTSTPKK